MDFKDFFSKEKINQNFFWALVLEPGLVQAAIWTTDEEKARVVSISNPALWGEDKELLNACDAALSSAIQNYPEDIGEPSKTVFGVSNRWVENGEIKPEYIEKIKKICTELSLEPSGFVVLSEAIAHLTKSEEGSPLSAVVIAVGEENIEISLFKLGNLVGTTSVARSISIPDDVIEGLTRFGLNETYPSRFLIYDGKEGGLEDAKQNLLSYDWETGEKIKFLHTPKIEIISPERKVTATALAGASEISNIKSIESIKEENQEIPEGTENVTLPEKTVKPEDLGFVVGEDVVKESQATPISPQPANVSKAETSAPGIQEKSKVVEKIEKVFSSFKNFLKKQPKQKIDIYKNKNIFVYGGIFFAVFIVLGILSWWFLPKVELIIYVSPKKLENKINLVIDTKASVNNPSDGVLMGKAIEVSKAGEKTKATTGTKTIGEKARGTVKIQNGTSSPIKISAGTILLSTGDLQFTIDNAASISAAISPSLPGETNVDISAYDIGAEYNLAKDEVFKVSNYPKSDVDAVAISDFSGGSSRQISAVSDEDQKDLLEELENELTENSKSEIKTKTQESQYFIEDSIVATISSKVFSNKIGDEATNLKLNLEINASGVVVESNDLFNFIKDSLAGQVPSGYVIRDDQVRIKFELQKVDDEKYDFNLLVEVNLLPQIDIDVIIENIKGRSAKVVEKYLETVPGFTRADISFNFSLPGKLNTLPHISKNISIELATER